MIAINEQTRNSIGPAEQMYCRIQQSYSNNTNNDITQAIKLITMGMKDLFRLHLPQFHSWWFETVHMKENCNVFVEDLQMLNKIAAEDVLCDALFSMLKITFM